MSNTYRIDRDGNKRKEGMHKKKTRYVCRCYHCLGKKDTLDKISEKEMKKELKNLHK